MNVSLLQWNVWYKEDIDNIVELLKQTKADVICLQELTKNFQAQVDTLAYVAGELGYHYFGSSPIDHKGLEWTQYNAIFSRFALADTKSVWINEPVGDGGYDDEYRAYIEATIKLGDKQLTVATTHMSYVDRFEASEHKKQETDRLVDILKNKSNSFVISGDFNAPPEGYTVQQVSKYLKNAGPDFSEKTWTTKPFAHKDFVENGLNWRLDYVFASPDVKVVSSEVLKTNYSDHLPVLTVLSV